MPIYEYECPACAKVFEVQQSMTDDPIETCPQCQGKVKKLISASSFQLKGGGWYSEGYSGPSNGNGKATEKKESTSPPPCQAGKESCKSCPAAT